MSTRVAVVALLAVGALCGCERERRDFIATPSDATAIESLRVPDVVAGAPRIDNPYERNAYALAQGKRLFGWYNCVGCHAQGGGGSGPALMDEAWIYGSDPASVFTTIVQGRPNVMPAFGGRISEKEAWELVAYVRSMSGLVSKQVAPNRADAIHAKPPDADAQRGPRDKVSSKP